MKKLIFVTVLLFATLCQCTIDIIKYPAAAQSSNELSQGLTNVGYAAFNLTSPKFNCDGFIESLRPLSELHVTFLYNTFGNDFSCLERILADERLKTLQVNLINEPGHRNKRLGPYEFLYDVGSVADYNKKISAHDSNLKNKLTEYVKPIQVFLANNLRPHTSVLINPGLESNLSTKGGRVLIQWTRELFPDARIVWNPHRVSLSTRKIVKADLIEGHGQFPNLKAPCVYNMDGTDVKYNNRPALGEGSGIKNYYHSGRPLFQHIEKYANRCEVAFIWSQEGNGLSYKTGFKDPRKRNHFIPTKVYKQIMRDVIALHRRGQIAPVQDTYTQSDDAIVKTCSVVSSNFEDGLKYGRLLKQSEFPERGGVAILPKEFQSVDSVVIVKGAKAIDTYQNTGPYHDGRPLFRSNRSPTTYPFNTYLVFDRGSTRYCYKLPNPRIRLD